MAEAMPPERRGADRIIAKWISLDTSVYITTPELIEALKDSARIGQESLDEVVALNQQQAAREQTRIRELHAYRLATTRTLGEKDTEITRLQKDLEVAKAQIRELGQHTATAFILSCLVLVLIAIGVNILTGDDNQAIGGVVVIIGLGLQVATYFVTKRAKDTV
ncbi:hypothetical protein [Microtetraspora malaysiensis]|uniref:DUF2335 domain-containing protein n=1 Tax=Microtetraspora malaysiensis TaxID=161358 RepID=A0ABW6SU58_9ACTN